MSQNVTNRVFSKLREKINQKNVPKLKTDIDYDGEFTKQDLWIAQPRFRDVSPENRPALFIKHLRMCSIVFDFSTELSGKENLGKEMKRQLLLAVVDHITTSKQWFSEVICKEILDMIAKNLFRDLPPAPPDFDPDEDDPVLDAQWPHLQIVYEFLLRFMVSTFTDGRILKKYVDRSFLCNLINLFRSEDPRERDYLKTILHRVYGKFMSFRSYIREAVTNVFYDVVYEDDGHPGISELLEILGSIVNGFALPLKNEHRTFLLRVLLPLHKCKNLAQFHQQLAYCTIQFIEKDPTLATDILAGLLQYWPLQSSQKELLFLNELDEVLDNSQVEQVLQVNTPLVIQIAKCMGSPHFQVAERALFLWNNDILLEYSRECKEKIIPLLVPELYKNAQFHWNQPVKTLTNNVTRLFTDLDGELFNQEEMKLAAEEDQEKQKHKEQKMVEQRQDFWASFKAKHSDAGTNVTA